MNVNMTSHFVDTSSVSTLDDPRLSLVFLPTQTDPDSSSALQLFHPIVGLVDSNFAMLSSANYNPLPVDMPSSLRPGVVDVPANAVVVFLRKNDTDDERPRDDDDEKACDDDDDRLASCVEYFSQPPWAFHHSEFVARHRIKACPDNSHAYYIASPTLPLCSVRQIHCGEEHIRIVRFASDEHWQDTLDFYMLILGHDYDCAKPDFCIFTVQHLDGFDVQFALKKLPQGVKPRASTQAILSITVTNTGLLVPLLPNSCHPISDSHWVTTDYDGNYVFLEQMSPALSPLHMMPRESTPNVSGIHPRSRMYMEAITSEDDSLFHSSTEPDTPASSSRHCARKHAPIYNHQHTDSGFMEDSSETNKVNLKKMFEEFSDASLSELFGRRQLKQQKSKSRRSRAREVNSTMPDLDLSVQSAYAGRPSSRCHNSTRDPIRERLRVGHMPMQSLSPRTVDPRLDPKQVFTEMWVLNGHVERPVRRSKTHGSSDDQVSTSSYSSLDTALSDPCSDRGQILLLKKTSHRTPLSIPEERVTSPLPTNSSHPCRKYPPSPVHNQTTRNHLEHEPNSDGFRHEPVDVPASLMIQKHTFAQTRTVPPTASRGFCDGVAIAEVHSESHGTRVQSPVNEPAIKVDSPQPIVTWLPPRKPKKVSFDEKVKSDTDSKEIPQTQTTLCDDGKSSGKGKASIQSVINSIEAGISGQGQEKQSERLVPESNKSPSSITIGRTANGKSLANDPMLQPQTRPIATTEQQGFWI